jgi:integrase
LRTVSQTKTYTAQHKLYDGEAMLYRTQASGDMWQFRTWIAEEKQYFRKSLKTRDLASAIERGKALYLDLRHQVKSGKKIFGLTVRELVEQFTVYQQQRVDAAIITSGRLSTIKTQLNRHFVGFLGKGDRHRGGQMRTGELEPGMFFDFAQYRRKHNQDVRDVTIRNEQSTFNALFKWAGRKGFTHFDHAQFAEIDIKNVDRRDTITLDEFGLLMKGFKTSWITKDLSPLEAERRKFICHFVLISIHTCMRFGELRQLKWGDVFRIYLASRDDKKQIWVAEVRVRKEIAKNRKERRFLTRGGEYFSQIKEYSRHTDKNDFVFCDNKTGNQIAKKVYYRLWKEVLSIMGLQDSDRLLTYYSLRHFGITLKLYANVSYEDVSELAGTSFAFIKNHYSHVDQGRLLRVVMAGFSVDGDGNIVNE